ncbi:MAG: M23 family metallopeptidase [Proteobacteria bacterium]|nr:M23 family metallopeptidase [Pseudomonadota bacterium]
MQIRDYTVMLVGDEQSPVRRFYISADKLRRGLWIAVAAAVFLVAGVWDYWRLRADNSELDMLRIEATEQREQIQSFERTLAAARENLTRVEELERKVRIIANLPGAASSGGVEVTELAPPTHGDLGEAPADLLPPAGVPVEKTEGPVAGPQAQVEPEHREDLLAEGLSTPGARHLRALDATAKQLGSRAGGRVGSLEELVAGLEDKRTKLASMPSIWPTRGWLTSRYGYRVSPFTGKRQRHNGIDIAAKPGTPVTSPARGRVKFVGRKGLLGNTVVIDHGYGVRTVYGHNAELYVSIGDEIVRGQQIASVGSTGRSTGPHLHYAVEIGGKHQDPLNYILD